MKGLSPIFSIFIVFLLLISVFTNVQASHTVSASPPGGTYSSTQSVVLESPGVPTATIYYTIDGTNPTTSSTLYTVPIAIETDATLKFMAVDPSDNHQSDVVTEVYAIDTVAPSIASTDPEDGETLVGVNDIITVTFSEAMDETTITTDSFTIVSEFDDIVSGTVTYDEETDSASFTPETFNASECVTCLQFGTNYVVTLTTEITDEAGNSLSEEFTFSFRTGGAMSVFLGDVETGELLAGSSFTVTPNPFTLTGSLEVVDNGEFDSDFLVFSGFVEGPTDGLISIANVEFSSYVLSQTTVPDGYVKIYDNMIFTVHETRRFGSMTVEDLNAGVSITDLTVAVTVPAPDLNSTQFELYEDNASSGIFSGVQGDELAEEEAIFNVGENAIPVANLATSASIDSLSELRSVIFTITAPDDSTGTEIFELFEIPTYPGIEEDILVQGEDLFYVPPAFVIPYEESANNFVLTPVISKVFPGLTLIMDQPSFVESEVAVVQRLNMTFDVEGENIGFSFGITDQRPPGTTRPPLDTRALFLDVGFVGNVDFSEEDAFQSSPKIEILVNKTLSGFDELEDGCTDFKLLLFDEDENEWKTVQKLRNPTIDTETQCGFTIEPEHFSKFAVGGVKNVLPESSSGGRNHGGTSVSQTLSGSDVEAGTNVGSESVYVKFESVTRSGQLKIESKDISKFKDIFEEMQDKTQGVVHIDDVRYASVGSIFEIDASNIEFEGMVEVTIPYKESDLEESQVRLLHYDEQGRWDDVTVSIDSDANTVTGILYSLSPVVAATVDDSTFGSTYFEFNPTKRLITDGSAIVTRADMGQQLSIPVTIKNVQRIDQTYTVLVQISDEDGVTRSVSWQTGSLAASQSAEVSTSWTAERIGIYTIQIFVWTDIDNPSPLSNATAWQLAIQD